MSDARPTPLDAIRLQALSLRDQGAALVTAADALLATIGGLEVRRQAPAGDAGPTEASAPVMGSQRPATAPAVPPVVPAAPGAPVERAARTRPQRFATFGGVVDMSHDRPVVEERSRPDPEAVQPGDRFAAETLPGELPDALEPDPSGSGDLVRVNSPVQE